jgi:lysophospholipase L1-like esterase
MKKAGLFFILFLVSGFFHMMQAQDWPNLSRFKTENEKLGNPMKDEHRVVFMGNSITEGWSSGYPEFFKAKPYINRGISGQTTPQMLVRFRQDVINLNPEIVVIMAGTNDIAGNTGPSTLEMIENNLQSMAELAEANGIKVILASVLPASDFPWKPGLEPADKILKLNSWIKEYTIKKKFIYLDYYSAMVDEQGGLKKELSGDGVHPNEEGYKVMVPLTEKAIENAILKKGKRQSKTKNK